MLTKLEKSEQEMTISALEIVKEISDEKSNLEVALTALGKQQERMSQDLFDQQKEINKTLLQSVMHIKESSTTHTVAFKVRQVSDTSPSAGDHVIYSVPVVNVGGGYYTRTGKYTVPRDGFYMFTIHMCTYSKKGLHLQIMAAGQVIEAIDYYEESYTGSCTSGYGVAVLSTSDKVWVHCKAANSGTVVFQSSDMYWNTFSGILIN